MKNESPNEEEFVLINEGKRAELALVVFEEYIEKKRKSSLDNLIRTFNEGEVDPKPYLSLVAKLSCYEEITRELSRTVNKGRTASAPESE